MQTITTIGLDIAKSVFQIHGIDVEGKVIVRRQLKRRYFLILQHSRRELLWLGVTARPSAHWIAHQLTEALA
jgi:transposase